MYSNLSIKKRNRQNSEVLTDTYINRVLLEKKQKKNEKEKGQN